MNERGRSPRRMVVKGDKKDRLAPVFQVDNTCAARRCNLYRALLVFFHFTQIGLIGLCRQPTEHLLHHGNPFAEGA